MERQPSTWSRAFFKTDTSCDAVENGASECFNSLIVSSRRKPIITMLEEIRALVMERVVRMSNKACNWDDEICPNIRKKVEKNKELMRNNFCRFWRVSPDGGSLFEVRQGLEGFVVDTQSRTCTCRNWQVSGIPCPHAVAAIYFIHEDPAKFVSPLFSTVDFTNTYNHKIKPLNGIKLWPRTNFAKLLPPKSRHMPGRPTIARRKDASEGGRHSRRNAYGHEVSSRVSFETDIPTIAKETISRGRIDIHGEVRQG
ncbi:hypothetical protein OSB04_013319 [Centaurea solstitialis]|uniref:SWIM-type domain-containing protein n=1 Tax=Centaurea solstitialis TaxID=347529 RepID=A0AA38TD11_9ASTR|nr:hypothetical protein OSB04_013319 [Centaurea solstitialis]